LKQCRWHHSSRQQSRYLCAGGPSIMMLIHRICIAFSGFGSCIIVDSVMRVSAAMLLYTQVCQR